MCHEDKPGVEEADQKGESHEGSRWIYYRSGSSYRNWIGNSVTLPLLPSPGDREGEWTPVPVADATSCNMKEYIRLRFTDDSPTGGAPNRSADDE
jgi:hypothetical protein